MKIVFDLTPIHDHLTGIERYSINISKKIIKAHPENEYILLFKNELHDSFSCERMLPYVKCRIIPGCNKLLFIQWRLYKELQKIEADYYLFLSFTSPVLFRKQRLINAIHDLTCWDCPDSIPTKMKYYYRYTYKVAAKRSWKIITVSQFSKKRICERYSLSEDKVPVIYDGLTDIFCIGPYDNPELKNKYKLPNKYILSLSTIEPRKNLQLLISAYKDLVTEYDQIPDLVLAGREGWKLDDIAGGIDETIKKRIHFTGFVEDKDLAQIYREAELFIFPSKYEGFGLPIIEAMSQGTLVICSNAASLPEIAGNAGIMFRSNDIDDLKRAICGFFNMTDKEREKRKQVGLCLSHNFSWDDEAEKLYKMML